MTGRSLPLLSALAGLVLASAFARPVGRGLTRVVIAIIYNQYIINCEDALSCYYNGEPCGQFRCQFAAGLVFPPESGPEIPLLAHPIGYG